MDSMQHQKENSLEVITTRKNQMKMLEIKNIITEMTIYSVIILRGLSSHKVYNSLDIRSFVLLSKSERVLST